MVFVVVVLQGQERPTNRPANPPTEQTKSAAGSRCCSRLPTPTPPPTPPPPPPLKRGEGTFQGERTDGRTDGRADNDGDKTNRKGGSRKEGGKGGRKEAILGGDAIRSRKFDHPPPLIVHFTFWENVSDGHGIIRRGTNERQPCRWLRGVGSSGRKEADRGNSVAAAAAESTSHAFPGGRSVALLCRHRERRRADSDLGGGAGNSRFFTAESETTTQKVSPYYDQLSGWHGSAGVNGRPPRTCGSCDDDERGLAAKARIRTIGCCAFGDVSAAAWGQTKRERRSD